MVRHTQNTRRGSTPPRENFDCLLDSPLCLWLNSVFGKGDKDAIRRRRKSDFDDGRYNWMYNDVSDNEEDKLERERQKEQRHRLVIIQMQSAVRSVIAQQLFKDFMTNPNPPLSTVTRFAHCLDPNDPTFNLKLRLNKLNVDLTSKSKTLRQEWQVVDNLDKEIAVLVKCNVAQRDLVSRFKKLDAKNKEQIKEAIAKHREEVCGDRKKRERVESYECLFYHLQTNPAYLAALIDQMTTFKDIASFTDRVLFPLFNRGRTPRDEYYFIKLMEFVIRKDVEKKIRHIEEISLGKLPILQLIKYFYSCKQKYKPISRALAAGIREIMSHHEKLTYTELSSSAMGRMFKRRKETTEYLYALAKRLVEATFSSVYKIPYGLRYLTNVLHECLQKKFPAEGKYSLLWPVGYFLSEYLRTAIEKPDQFGFRVDETQRKNLLLISSIFRNTMESFAPYRMQAPGMDDFINGVSQNLRGFFRQILDVPDIGIELSFSKYTDAVQISEITMNAEDIIYTHSLLSKHENVVFCNQGNLQTTDIAYQVYKDIGPVPLLKDLEGTSGALYNERRKITRFPLYLFSKVPIVEDLDIEKEKANISSMKLVLELMAKRPEEQIIGSLKPAEEMGDQTVIGSKTSTTKEAQKQNKSGSTKDQDASQDIEAQIRAERLKILQKAGYFAEAGSEQEFCNLMKKEIKNKHQLRLKREEDVKFTEQALANINKAIQRLHNTTDTCKTYRKSCMDNLLGEKSSIHGEVQKIHFAEDEIVCTAKELFKKGVIVNTQGKIKEMKREFLGIMADGEHFYVRLDEEQEKIPIMDIVHAHYSDNPTMKIFHYDVDVGMFLFLVCSNLYETSA